jgi:inosine-uridine nucleoside N-ribohydrolase
MSGVDCASFQFAFLCLIRQAKSTLLLGCVALVAVAVQPSPAETIWIDTDISIGSAVREVDDAFALLLAFHSPNLKIAGISTSYGNASLGTTTAAARQLLAKLEQGRPIYPGAKSRNDLARETDASNALAATLRKERHLTYVALGPLTNLAAFETNHPQLIGHISRVIFIGGTTATTSLRFGSRHPIQIHDANVVKDRVAVAQVLKGKTPITIIPVEIAAQFTVTAKELDAMRANPAGDYIQRHSRFWLWFWTKFVGTEGAPIFDAAAILAVTNPEQFTIETRTASIDDAGNLVVAPKSAAGGRKVSTFVRLSNRPNSLNLVRRRLRSSER